MIYVTTAANDADLLKNLTKKGLGVPQSDLPADFAFKGQWDGSREMWVCGDRKKVGDLLNCIRDGRHIQQIQRCNEAGYEIQYLIVEGSPLQAHPGGEVAQHFKGKEWRIHPTGVLWSEYQAYLEEIQLYGGVQVRYSKTLAGTVHHIMQAYKTLSIPPEAHKVLHKVYSTPHTGAADMLQRRPSLLRRIAKELPGVGWELSQRVEDHYGSVKEMIGSSKRDLMEIDGIGETKAERIVDDLGSTKFRSTARRN